MATLVSYANGNFTGATTFRATDTAAGSINLIRFNNTTIAAAATFTSATFTVTNGAVIDGAILYLKSTAAGPTGTVKVALNKSGVEQASVTVNKTDLQDDTSTFWGPGCFKFTGTATGDGAATWTIVITTTGTGTVSYQYTASGQTSSISRALRTTTAAAPAAADDLYIVGEFTGAGTHNSFTVTMDNTTATVFGNGGINSTTVNGGGVAIACYGTLTYDLTVNTILRLAGDLTVYQFGRLNIGSVGAEIPRNKTAVLEFQQAAADGNFGLLCLHNSIVNIAGLSRTSGKNVTKCKLTANVVSVNVIDATNSLTAATAPVALDATGNSLLTAFGLVDTAANSAHGIYWSSPSVTNTTQTGTCWLARGSGTNNRYVRVAMSSANASMTNGFYVDVDLQAGTLGTPGAAGLGSVTGATITPQNGGYVVRVTGKASSAAGTVWLIAYACSALGTNVYVGNTTQCFIIDHFAIVTASSISDTAFNVDADTGWLNGDAVCVASTTRTMTECEIYPLNADAGASSFTSALYPFSSNSIHSGVHHGTAPTQGEIGLLTRNVKIRSTSTTLMTYMYCTASSVVNASWAEFYYLGANVTVKRGIEVDGGTTAGAKSFTYCSVHDIDYAGVVVATAACVSLNLTFSNNVMWNINGAANPFTLIGTVTNNDYVIDNNLIMRTAANGSGGFWLGDVGGVVTNNIAVGTTGGSSHGFVFAEVGGAIGTFSGNSAHCQGGWGLVNNANNTTTGLVDGFTTWRNATGGIHTNGGDCTNMVFKDIIMFGSGTNFYLHTSANKLTVIGTSCMSSETTYTSSHGIVQTMGTPCCFDVTGVDFTGSSIGISPVVPHSVSDIAFTTAASFAPYGWFNNCKFNATPINSTASWVHWAYLGFQRFGQVDGDHRTYMKYGVVQTDMLAYHTDTPSMKMVPNSATSKLESAPEGLGIIVPVNSGMAVTGSAWIRKDAFYLGSQPRMIVRANPSIGIDGDVVLATCSDVTSGASFATFNITSPGTILSNGNLTTTHGTGGNGATSTVVAPQTTGKFYFEIMPVTSVALSSGFGILSYPDGTKYISLAYTAGNMFVDGVAQGTIGGYIGAGYWIGFAVDLTNRLCWMRPAANIGGITPGNWNNNPAANPVTGVGGHAIYPGLAFVPWAVYQSSDASNAYTINLGQSAYNYTRPTGFGDWTMPPYAGTGSWVQISGTTPVVDDDGALEFAVDCDGTGVGGHIDVDDWSFAGFGTPAGGLKYWFDGAPASAFGQAGGGLKYWFNGLPVIGSLGGAGYFWAGII